jgi:hypothetical protein
MSSTVCCVARGTGLAPVDTVNSKPVLIVDDDDASLMTKVLADWFWYSHGYKRGRGTEYLRPAEMPASFY